MNFSHFGHTIHVAVCFAQPIKTRVTRDTLESLEVGTCYLRHHGVTQKAPLLLPPYI